MSVLLFIFAKQIIIMSETATQVLKIDQACPISLTGEALSEIKAIINEQNVPGDHGLRIGVRGGGCSGFQYMMGFDVEKENDEVFEMDNVKILLNKMHGMYLVGMEIDYYYGLDNRGFIFNNPNAQSTCGCGSSFTA